MMKVSLTEILIGIALYCEEGIPLLLANDTVKKCLPDENSDSNMQCPKNFWCHIGATENSWYCCPRNRKGAIIDVIADPRLYIKLKVEKIRQSLAS